MIDPRRNRFLPSTCHLAFVLSFLSSVDSSSSSLCSSEPPLWSPPPSSVWHALPVGAQPPFAQLYFLQNLLSTKKSQYFLVFLLVLTVPSQKLNWTLIIEWSGPPPKWYLWMISLISGLLTCSLGLQCFQASSSGVAEKRRVRKINIEGYLSDSW